ncbi:uncharacterized protein [Montipora foliosa]|uniref:uncharacterized protein n=1 Tax=Montipora foliosa TaxID=591990 RepID=UPI0035F12CC5
MSVSSSRYPLIRISKGGEMRLKNKVGNAILKENAYEDRALNTTLDTLSKHQFRQDKYMTYRQLEFATKQVSASEERPRTLFSAESRHFEASDHSLPPIVTRRGSNVVASADMEERRRSSQNGEIAGRNKAKGRWEKAITMVRVAVQNRNTAESNGRTLAGLNKKPLKLHEEHSLGLNTNQLPPINVKERAPREASSFRKKLLRKQPSLPEMLRISREKSQNCLHDPRFMKLEQCLRQTSRSRDENLWRNSSANLTERISRISHTR